MIRLLKHYNKLRTSSIKNLRIDLSIRIKNQTNSKLIKRSRILNKKLMIALTGMMRKELLENSQSATCSEVCLTYMEIDKSLKMAKSWALPQQVYLPLSLTDLIMPIHSCGMRVSSNIWWVFGTRIWLTKSSHRGSTKQIKKPDGSLESKCSVAKADGPLLLLHMPRAHSMPILQVSIFYLTLS